MIREVILSPEAERDLSSIYPYIAERSGRGRALTYINRIVACLHGLAEFPERGARRDDIRPGLRVLGFERRVLIAFRGHPDRVVVGRILYGGRDLEGLGEAP